MIFLDMRFANRELEGFGKGGDYEKARGDEVA
jgi:hypothetical protein